ncbi:uncharacterized protein LOC124288384 [Haliotis rubra]|uniref:uncharacterized protein LOC124288384 n=1 Tax=Haliotis rubra TaxID=36100 RepID=UPI001EE580B5|nr:uncharacterized protein LOC124288384 [Haliotis rubra]
MDVLYCLTGLLLVLTEDVKAEYCYSYSSDYSSSYSSGTYCSAGCCGSYDDQYCCTSVSAIVGASVGSFFFIVIVIAVICACVKSANRPGRVVGPPAVGATMVVTTTGMSAQQGQPHYSGYAGQVPLPPAYNTYPPPGQGMYPPPPQYNGQQPVYPPK